MPGPRPNLFIIGAMKSATTSLHSYLSSHPEIFMSDPKEPSYFAEESQLFKEFPVMTRKGFWKNEKSYLSLFLDAGNAKLIGESSTIYTKRPRIEGIPNKIKAFAPDARLIYIMRDPVERTISHYWHEARWFNEDRDILEAVTQTPFYRQVSHYAMQLQPYFSLFSREQIYTLTSEELGNRPEVTLRRIFQWLGVEADIITPSLAQRDNVTPSVIYRLRGLGSLHRLRYSRFWNAVGPKVPKRLRSFARRFSESQIQRSQIDLKKVQEFLRPIHLKEAGQLEDLLGRQFPEWATLYDTAETELPR